MKAKTIKEPAKGMSKYIKLADAINGDCILIDEIKCEDCPFCNEDRDSCKMVEWLKSLPTIEIPTELNGVILKDCDKVIAPFLEEHECDELWETVRALRDFYDCATEEERKVTQ